jgi:hypothetical protein
MSITVIIQSVSCNSATRIENIEINEYPAPLLCSAIQLSPHPTSPHSTSHLLKSLTITFNVLIDPTAVQLKVFIHHKSHSDGAFLHEFHLDVLHSPHRVTRACEVFVRVVFRFVCGVCAYCCALRCGVKWEGVTRDDAWGWSHWGTIDIK